jgi:murein DD-endopeptidase MepM/ murein hydrolase activator NlpD
MNRLLPALLSGCLALGASVCAASPPELGRIEPLVRVVDLALDEEAQVELHDGSTATVRLLELHETRDPIREAVRKAVVRVRVNGEEVTLESGMYNLPVTVAGVQIDCPVTSGYNVNGRPEYWGLDKAAPRGVREERPLRSDQKAGAEAPSEPPGAARLRLWPAGSPLVRPGTFGYPVNQKWFASGTWFDNEPVDGGDRITKTNIYYHSGLDIGGAEGMVDILAATDGLVVSSGLEVLEGHKEGTPVRPRYDVVYVLDARGWYYRYSHMQSIEERIVPGRIIERGERIGVLGKEGASGGWSHLHFEIKSRQPSGKWGTQAGYAFIREAYLNEHAPEIIACARPRHLIMAGDSTVLDGSRSWSAADEIVRYEWTFTDGSTAEGPRVERTYPRPGRYSEVLKVTDGAGNVDHDFTVVQVIDPEKPDRYVPSMHAAYAPSLKVGPGEPVTFKVRTFRIEGGEESWDFGDGSPPVTTLSDGGADKHNPDGYAVTVHRYEQPGDYIVTVQRTDNQGVPAFDQLHVRVE